MPPANPPVVVLIVEDDRLVGQAMKLLLVSQGFVVNVVETVAEALERVGNCKLLLLDMDLPDGLGTEVLQHINDHSLIVRVAVISGTEQSDLLTQARELGADVFFQKPVNFSELQIWLDA